MAPTRISKGKRGDFLLDSPNPKFFFLFKVHTRDTSYSQNLFMVDGFEKLLGILPSGLDIPTSVTLSFVR